ncbi:hypothetical protein [Ralstonia pseudosolanacearum]|uniref:Uncharacterized protein n=1 Tax=Ralstonia solanacearum TaxID=305 RepID=A0AA92QCK8_RALSL|nr:hypothetical protein [Ralstonia pseudosolanacearum]QOK98400.1 hypothetical protein HF909_19760 [Ralstonia pseudosolanacearum]UWD88376.1 hypothetical protein NY025_06675 [Ralstonia pseudosolanacearum]
MLFFDAKYCFQIGSGAVCVFAFWGKRFLNVLFLMSDVIFVLFLRCGSFFLLDRVAIRRRRLDKEVDARPCCADTPADRRAHGQTHRVVAMPNGGLEYNGEPYRSLNAIADVLWERNGAKKQRKGNRCMSVEALQAAPALHDRHPQVLRRGVRPGLQVDRRTA